MKTKLIAFNTTNVLEKSVGEVVAGINPASAEAGREILKAGLPFTENILKTMGINYFREYFMGEHYVQAVAREFTEKFGVEAGVREGQIFPYAISEDQILLKLAEWEEPKRDLIVSIHLVGLEMTISGLMALSKLRNLARLYLYKTPFGDASLKSLKEFLPELKIFIRNRSGLNEWVQYTIRE